MYSLIQRFLHRFSDWRLRSATKQKARKPAAPDADPCREEDSSIHILKKKLTAIFARCKPAAAYGWHCLELAGKMAVKAGRILSDKLKTHWQNLRETVSGWKLANRLESRFSRARESKSIKLAEGNISLIRKIAFVAVCILFVTGLLSYTRRNIVRFEEETVRNVNQYMSGVAREKGQCIEQSVKDIQSYLSLLAMKPFSGEFKTGQPVRYKDYVAGEAVLKHVGGKVDSIYRIDRRGMVLHRVPYNKSSIGDDLSQTPGIRSVLENHEPSVSEAFPLHPDTLGLSVCHPVFDGKRFMGAICIMISLETLNNSICPIQTGAPGSIWVIDNDGLVISHTNPDFVGKRILEVEESFIDSNGSDFENIVRRMENGEEGHAVYRSMEEVEGKREKVKKAVAFLPVNLHNQTWSIAITMDYGEISDPVKRNARNNFLVTALMMLIFGIVGTIYYRSQKKKAELEVITRSAEELRVINEKLKQEIEQRVQAEQAREKSEDNYRLLAENVSDIIWLTDLELRLAYISPSVERVLGIDPQKATGQTIEKILTPASLETAMKALGEELSAARKGQKDRTGARMLDLELYGKDGATIWAETKFSFLYDAEGMPTGILGVTRDITEKMQLQQQFLQAQKMESVGRLAGGVAHDFNNLISGILGYASLLKGKATRNAKIFRYADTIETSANRAGELTKQLLAFARGGKYEPKIINLNRIVDETLQIIDRTFDKSIEIEVDLQDSIPTVEADAGQMQQVFMNLCVNARDAMGKEGKLTIETSEETLTPEEAEKEADARPGSYVVFSISDTGVGMDDETLKRIFEPFFTTKEKGKGTGLGLAMVYGVTRNHGGHVHVSSKPGKGTTFKVYVPASGKPETKEKPRTRRMRGKNEKILVVDDEQVSRSLAKDALETYGYNVILAKDGPEAIEIFKENNGTLSLVILDMVMPKMGGRETYLKLKQLNKGIKAILLTGYAKNEEANEILQNGVREFIQKPFHLNELLYKVRATLDSD